MEICTCNPRPRIVKNRAGRWICSACRREREPRFQTLESLTLVRTDSAGVRQPATLSALRHDLEDADGGAALLALVSAGEAATPNAWYELEAGDLS